MIAMPASPSLVETPTPRRLKPGPWQIDDVLDRRALRVRLDAASRPGGDEAQSRKNAVDALHQALFRGRLIAQERLQQGADGLDTARLLSAVTDEVVRALHDHVVAGLAPEDGPMAALSVCALGGYGRGVLAPSSDVDLLFLTPGKPEPAHQAVIEAMLHMLWDMGLKVGHSCRDADACVALANTDVSAWTALLDTRFLCGDAALAARLRATVASELVGKRQGEFIAAKLQERDARHTRQGDARYVVEPNVKEGKGGLRDLQTLYWIVKHVHGGDSLEDVLASEVFTPPERRSFFTAARFLWTVRCHLHFIMGRSEERLTFDIQPEIAARMGYRDRRGQRGVERFMKRYFLIAKEVGALTRILSAKLEAEHDIRPSERLLRFLPGLAASRSKPIAGTDFALDRGRVSLARPGLFREEPIEMLRLFQVAADQGADVHPDAMSSVTRNLKAFGAGQRRDPEASEIFLGILLDTEDPRLHLDRMNQAGLLGRLLPEFGQIVGQTQFNMYHHFTVDEHTLRAVGHLSDMEHGRGETVPGAKERFSEITNRRALYLAMLLHDTGKGLGDQQVEGEQTTRTAALRLGLPEEEAELAAWLVRHHLEMSETAQKRDLSDPMTISAFARLVGDVERLRLLYLLTIADMKAVGPGIFSGWKHQLLTELGFATAAALRGGRTDDAAVTAGLAARADACRAALQADGVLPEELLGMEQAYFTSFAKEEIEWHASVIKPGGGVSCGTRSPEGGAQTVLMVGAPERPGLFASWLREIVRAGANVETAQALSGSNGYVLNVFSLTAPGGGAFGASDAERLRSLCRHVCEAGPGEADPVTPPAVSRRAAAFRIEPKVSFSNGLSEHHTVIDITARDRPGLLFDVAQVLASEGISLHSAHAGSYGERVFDAFYVRGPNGAKLTPEMMEQLRGKLASAANAQGGDAPATPARQLRQAAPSDSF